MAANATFMRPGKARASRHRSNDCAQWPCGLLACGRLHDDETRSDGLSGEVIILASVKVIEESEK